MSDYVTVSDYALITVSEDLTQYIESSNYQYELGSITDSDLAAQLTVATVGFPQYLNPNTPLQKEINSGSEHSELLSFGSITKIESETFNYNADTSGGNSGGPIYATEEFNDGLRKVVIGINVAHPTKDTTYNIGTRFTARELKFYNSNPNLKW